MLSFIASSPDDPDASYLRGGPYVGQTIWEGLIRGLFTTRGLDLIWNELALRPAASAFAAPPPPRAWNVLRKHPRRRLALLFQGMALRKLDRMIRREGGRFWFVFLYTGESQFVDEEPLYEHVLRRFCEREGIRFLSMRPAFEPRIAAGDQLFLRIDGHFNDRGAALAARVLSAALGSPGEGERVVDQARSVPLS